MDSETGSVRGMAAGVPFLAVPPDGGARPGAPAVVAWHLMDPPRTEGALAAALPMTGLDAWRIYLGLPLFGSRLPAGGMDEVMRLSAEDVVLNVHGPVVSQAAAEFGDAFAELRGRLDLGDGPIGLLGGSAGAAVAGLVLTESDVPVAAGVLVSPLVQLRATVDALGQAYGLTYAWSDASLDVARRLDLVARAPEIARRGQPALLLVVGEDDLADGFAQPAALLREELATRYDEPGRTELVSVPGMGHALAEEPGLEPAPQTPHAAVVDRRVVGWFGRHLVRAPVGGVERAPR
jgi:pimeloyl-ACP methyl ester carboxylesterase